MHKKKEIALRLLRIGILLIVIVAACRLPVFQQQRYDARAEERPEYFDTHVTTFQTDYKSFGDKLKVLAICRSYGLELKELALEDYTQTMDDEQLTKIVSGELEKIRELDEEYGLNMMPYTISKNDLTRREKYTMYAADDRPKAEGLDYWELDYETDEWKLTVKMDADFYKIFGLQLTEYGQKEENSADGWTGSSYGKVYDEKMGMYYDKVTGNYYDEEYWAQSIREQAADTIMRELIHYWEMDISGMDWGPDSDVNIPWLFTCAFFIGGEDEVIEKADVGMAFAGDSQDTQILFELPVWIDVGLDNSFKFLIGEEAYEAYEAYEANAASGTDSAVSGQKSYDDKVMKN